MCVVQEYGKRYTKFFEELASVSLFILRNSNDSYTAVSICFVDSFKERKRILAHRARNFEEGDNHRTARQRLAQGELPPINGGQSKVRCSSSLWAKRASNILRKKG